MPASDKNTSTSQLLKVATAEAQKDIYTCIPGHVLAFDPVKQRAQIQIGLVRIDISGVAFTPKPIVDVPVQFPGSNGYAIEFQIDPGCEGLVMFSQRCIDGWKQTGGVADNPIGRFHRPQDAIFIPGIRSQPNVISDFRNNGIRLRNKDSKQTIWLKNDGGIEQNNSNGYTRLMPDGTFVINGVSIDKNGNITAPNSLKLAGKELKDHRHNGVQSGSSTSGINQ